MFAMLGSPSYAKSLKSIETLGAFEKSVVPNNLLVVR